MNTNKTPLELFYEAIEAIDLNTLSDDELETYIDTMCDKHGVASREYIRRLESEFDSLNSEH